MKYQIGVFGSGNLYPSSNHVAYLVGREIASKGHILISGGLGGVMEASCKGAKEKNGLTIGIIPSKNFCDGNSYLDVSVLTDMGAGRNYLTGLSCQGCIIVGGSEGTLCEAKVVYDGRGPVVIIENTGGTADFLKKHGFPSMEKKEIPIHSAKNASEAVKLLIKLLENKK